LYIYVYVCKTLTIARSVNYCTHTQWLVRTYNHTYIYIYTYFALETTDRLDSNFPRNTREYCLCVYSRARVCFEKDPSGTANRVCRCFFLLFFLLYDYLIIPTDRPDPVGFPSFSVVRTHGFNDNEFDVLNVIVRVTTLYYRDKPTVTRSSSLNFCLFENIESFE